jgi:uncharacterized protein (TIGR02145 family)
MKINFFIVVFTILSIFPSFGLSYTINFTASGATTTVGDVTVQNLTKGTSVVVPAGNVLILTDATALNQINSDPNNIHVYSNNTGSIKLSFNAILAGRATVSIFSFDGKKLAENYSILHAGINTFQISLPQGDFIIRVKGNGYNYSSKTTNSAHSISQISIQHENVQSENTIQKVKCELPTTTMNYSAGDVLLYKCTSEKYSNIVVDVPATSKSTNFNFDTCTDVDGNNYCTVTIGTQTWMAENLKTTSYKDGTNIQNLWNDDAWANDTTGSYCWYNNNNANKTVYGALYNWYAVNSGKLAPAGWHVPTEDEFITLKRIINNGYYNSSSIDSIGGKIKESGFSHWTNPNTGATNETGFSALPAGARIVNGTASFININKNGAWWTATDDVGTPNAWFEYVSYKNTGFYYLNPPKSSGCSVRCVKD